MIKSQMLPVRCSFTALLGLFFRYAGDKSGITRIISKGLLPERTNRLEPDSDWLEGIGLVWQQDQITFFLNITKINIYG